MDGHAFLRSGVKHPVLGDGVAAVGNQLPVENVVVRIQPLLDYRKYILAAYG